MTKQCPRCQRTLDVSLFGTKTGSLRKDGTRSIRIATYCKPCYNEYWKRSNRKERQSLAKPLRDENTRQCIQCQETLPKSAFRQRDGFVRKDGAKNKIAVSYCRKCESQYQMNWRKKKGIKSPLVRKGQVCRLIRIGAYSLLISKCIVCEKTLEVSQFNKKHTSILDPFHSCSASCYNSRCKDCSKKESKEYYQNNRAVALEKREKYYQTHRDYHREYMRMWRQRNPEKVKEISARHRGRYVKESGLLTHQEWEFLKAVSQYSCLNCGRKEPEIRLVADHVVPYSQGGKNIFTNIQPLCGRCNSKKATKTIDYRYKINECIAA